MPGNTYTYTGHTFAGWVVSGTDSLAGTYAAGASVAVSALSTTIANGNASITLTAAWTANTLTISYANGGGGGSAPSSPTSATYGNSVTMPTNTFNRTGYTFAGWEVSGTGSTYAAGTSVAVSTLSTAIASGNASITLTARWNIDQYTVTYYPDGGTPTPTSPVTVDYGSTIIQPSAMTKTGFTFDNWYTDSAKTISAKFPITVTGNVNLYAKWILAIDMILVPSGSFEMGNRWDPIPEENPAHTVFLTSFYMGKYEVTQEQYQAVMGSNPSYFTSNPVSGDVQGNRPVENLGWYDAIVFCNKLSMVEGLIPAYRILGSTDPAVWGTPPTDGNSTWDSVVIVSGSNGYRLPTEAQWEYAAKGGNGSPGNYEYSGSDDASLVAWHQDNSNYKTHEVGKKAPNSLGLYDMSGNVAEWCWDWYGDYSSGVQTDPGGADSGSRRIQRGGSFIHQRGNSRSTSRGNFNPTGGGANFMGIRLVRPAP